MKVKRSIKNRSVLITWLFSYIIFLILFLTISVLIYYKTEKTIKTEINNANSFMLKATQTNMDNVLENIKKVSMELCNNPNIRHILLLKGDFKNSDYFEVYKLVSTLNSYRNSNNSISSIYILLKNHNTVITADGVFALADFYRDNYSAKETDFLNWLGEFDVMVPEKYFTLYMDKAHVNDNKLNYVRSLSQVPYTNLSDSSGIVLNATTLMQQLESIDTMTKGTSFIIDRNNNIIASSSPINPSTVPKYQDLSGESGVLYKYIHSEKAVISYITSKQAEWKYVTVIDNHVFYEKLNYIRYFTLLSLALIIILGLFLAYYFIKKNYNPLSKLLDILKDKTRGEKSSSNEYILLENAIQQTLKDNDLINHELLSQKAVLRSNFLEKLLKGSSNNGIPLEEGLSSFDITFASDFFAVISFFPVDSNEEIISLNEYFGNGFNALNFVLTNIIVELINEKNKAYTIEIDNTVVYLINLSEEHLLSAKSDMLNAVAVAQEFIHKHFNIYITFSISGIHEKIENIPDAYNESLYTMNYKNIMGIKQNIIYDDISTHTCKDTYYYPLSQEQQLLTYIKSGNYLMAKEIIDGVFSKNLQAGMTVELAQCLMLNMVSTMIRAINSIPNMENNNFLQGVNPINQLLHCKTLDQMKNQLDSFLKSFCAYVNQTIEKSSSWVVSSVVPYLEENYSDPNLGLDQIGKQFDVHPVYISKVFKDHVGEGLLDFITKLRVEHSKVLLKEDKNATIEKIAEFVGYPNVRTFARVFKKYTNVSPGKYRDEIN